ncbi:hypothetical protein [Flavobacterium sp.]|uniref:hypothetical protein n=1 Tax=Flavobacterium sp. TaxID=239 RepID=UPI003750AF77
MKNSKSENPKSENLDDFDITNSFADYPEYCANEDIYNNPKPESSKEKDTDFTEEFEEEK